MLATKWSLRGTKGSYSLSLSFIGRCTHTHTRVLSRLTLSRQAKEYNTHTQEREKSERVRELLPFFAINIPRVGGDVV